MASFAGFARVTRWGRRAARSACHCAFVARYPKPPPRVAALRRNSRDSVEGARPSRRAISRTPWPWTRRSAISSRSVKERYRPDGGFAAGASCDGGMPPASRNHLVPTGGDTPASTAASSLDRPAAIADQNTRRCSRRPTGGRPGERRASRTDLAERRFFFVIATSCIRLLRRPVESALDAAIAVVDQAITPHRTPVVQRLRQGVEDEAGAGCRRNTPAPSVKRLAGGRRHR